MSGKRANSGRKSVERDDAPEITAAWVAEADVYRGQRLVRRGRPRLANPRQLLSLRIPPDVIAGWKATGPGWQSRMVAVLEREMPGPRAARRKARAS
jgi:uncharacterized protein (DUF4415 family)